MSNKGWISIHRSIQDCCLWTDNQPFDRRSAWIDLLLSVNHRDKEIIFNGSKITIKRGQYLTSIRGLAQRWSWSNDRTLRFMKLLESLEMIERESDNFRTLITIVNYEVYQNVCDTDKYTDKDTNKDTDKSQTIMKNNVNNVNKVFVPPTVEEVSQYCLERHNKVDPNRFTDFYSAKNWMIGKNKMKDWKAAVRTWEKGDNSKPTSKLENSRTYDFDELEKEILNN